MRVLACAAAVLSLALAGRAEPASHPAAPTKNIVELAVSVPDLSTLVKALTDGKLVSALEAKGPFTVFAPTNEAFAKLPAATLKTLQDPANIKELQDILEYHVVEGAAVYSKDLKADQNVTTLEGKAVEITKSGGNVYVNKNSQVTAADDAATNGVVHIIDTVLIPPTFGGMIGSPDSDVQRGPIFI